MARGLVSLHLALGLAAGCTSNAAPELAGSFRVTVRSSASSVGVRLEGGVVSNCTGVLERNWERALEYPLSLRIDDEEEVELPEGEFGLVARFVNENCEVVAFGCLPVSIEASRESARFVIDVESMELGSSCGTTEECTDGACTPLPGIDAGSPLPDGVSLSPDGDGYCASPEGSHCGCMSLDHYCEGLPCSASNFVCDYPLGDLRDETDEHGCVRVVLFDSGDTCP